MASQPVYLVTAKKLVRCADCARTIGELPDVSVREMPKPVYKPRMQQFNPREMAKVLAQKFDWRVKAAGE
jgi:hypothetical protein